MIDVRRENSVKCIYTVYEKRYSIARSNFYVYISQASNLIFHFN